MATQSIGRQPYVGVRRLALLAATSINMLLGSCLPATAFSFSGPSGILRGTSKVVGGGGAAAAGRQRSDKDVTSRVTSTTPWRRRHRGDEPSMRIGVTSSVIETVAKGILNLALANPRQATVECRISSSAMDLVRGNLDQAKVDGLNWATPMGLTMRTIAMTLNGMQIMPAEVFRGKITFKCPAEGRAVLDLDAQDFGNFLVHPLMAKADLPSGDFEFRREGTVLDVDIGRATFTGVWQGQPVVMEACQPDRFGKIYARVAQRGRLTDLGIQTLSTEMTYFFNTVVLDLDGTSVRFEDMYHGYNSAGEASLRVTVGVVVHRLPNPENMKF